MSLQTYNDFINRVGGNFTLEEPIYGDLSVGTTTTALGGINGTYQLNGYSRTLPTLPSGVTAYIPTRVSLIGSATYAYMLCKAINMGSLDLATPTFTDGAAFPTVTELGVSRQTSGAIFMEVTTALNSAPGSITVTYVDQDGNTAETTTAQALAASSVTGSAGWILLNSPDWGVRDITTATRTGGTTPTGVVKFWGLIPIAFLTSVSGFDFRNLLTHSFNPIRLGAGDNIRLFGWSGNPGKTVLGDIFYIGDN